MYSTLNFLQFNRCNFCFILAGISILLSVDLNSESLHMEESIWNCADIYCWFWHIQVFLLFALWQMCVVSSWSGSGICNPNLIRLLVIKVCYLMFLSNNCHLFSYNFLRTGSFLNSLLFTILFICLFLSHFFFSILMRGVLKNQRLSTFIQVMIVC